MSKTKNKDRFHKTMAQAGELPEGPLLESEMTPVQKAECSTLEHLTTEHWNGRYVLDEDGEPKPEQDLLAWSRFLKDAVARTIGCDMVNGANVSTVFLGMDHNLGISEDAPPVLWETCIFWDWAPGVICESDVVERYDSKVAAYMGHQRWRGKVAAGLTSAKLREDDVEA